MLTIEEVKEKLEEELFKLCMFEEFKKIVRYKDGDIEYEAHFIKTNRTNDDRVIYNCNVYTVINGNEIVYPLLKVTSSCSKSALKYCSKPRKDNVKAFGKEIECSIRNNFKSFIEDIISSHNPAVVRVINDEIDYEICIVDMGSNNANISFVNKDWGCRIIVTKDTRHKGDKGILPFKYLEQIIQKLEKDLSS